MQKEEKIMAEASMLVRRGTMVAAALALCAAPFAHVAKAADGVERAMKYAPDGVVALIHVEVKAQVKDVLAGTVKALEPNAFPPDFIRAADSLAEKVEAMDIFLLAREGGPPMPVVLAYGTLTPADTREFLTAAPGPLSGLTLTKGENGRYALERKNRGVPVTVLFGGEAPELPAGIVMAGLAPMFTKEFLAGLGKGNHGDVASPLKDVDTSAPIWGAMVTDKLTRDPGAPRTIVGSMYLLGGGKSRVSFEFRDANWAQRFQEQNGEMRGVFGKAIAKSIASGVEGTVVTFSAKDASPLVPILAAYLAEARKATVSMLNLGRIGCAVNSYQESHKGQMPPDLLTLVRVKAITGQMLVSPISGREITWDANGLLPEGFESDYVYVKYSMPLSKIPRPESMIVAYEKAKDYRNEGTVALFLDWHVQLLSAEEFARRLKASRDLIASQQKETP
jgi:hypothetical protein